MRVERIEIDGFGRFHDAHWTLGDGLSVLVGANEAGKTTLLNALRALLFGFESTREGRTWYPALAGGRRGGRLVLLTAAGERWTVERHGDRGGAGALAVRAPNGNQGGQETLDRLLHGADRDLFNNIFAFGLGELQSFGSLSAEGVRGRIYGAGAGLGGTSAVELERRLRQQQEATFTVRGSQKPLNALLARVETLRAEVADLTAQPAEHAAATRERDELRAAATRVRTDLRRRREATIRLDHLRRAVAPASELTAIGAELESGDPTLDSMPPDAVAILDRRLADLAEARTMLAGIDEQLDEATAARAATHVDEPLLSAADEISGLGEARAERAAAERERRELVAAEARHASAVAEQAAHAGGWEETRLLAIDDSIPAVEETRRLERAIGESRSAHAAAEQRRLALADELAAQNRGQPGAEVGDETGLAGRAAALRELDALRQERAGAGARASGDWRPTARAALLAAAIVIVATVLGLLVGQPLAGAIGGMAIGAGVLVAWRPAGAAPAATDELDRRRIDLLSRAGLPADTDDARLHELAIELAAERTRREVAREQHASLSARRDELARREREAESTRAAAEAAERAWRAWLVGHDLPDHVSPEAARQLLSVAGVAKRAAAEREHTRQRLASHERDDEAFARRAAALLGTLGIEAPTDRARLDAELARVVERLHRTRADARRAEELHETVARLRQRQEPAAALVGTREAAVAEHLALLGCPDADALRRREAAAVERRALRARSRELTAGLAGIAGSEAAIAPLVAELTLRDAAVVEADLEQAGADQDRLEREEHEIQKRIGELDARIRQLEAAEELGARRQELAMLEGRAAAMGREWAVRAVALRLLEETRARYERERQPDVVRAAESHFARITGGRYARIVAPPGDSSVRVETDGGEARVTDELSRGTAEQLYLALRFGLIEEFARHAEPLPVVMDDILVNFDADRADRAASAIRDLATRHQVVYFTCHRWTAELLDPSGGRTLALG